MKSERSSEFGMPEQTDRLYLLGLFPWQLGLLLIGARLKFDDNYTLFSGPLHCAEKRKHFISNRHVVLKNNPAFLVQDCMASFIHSCHFHRAAKSRLLLPARGKSKWACRPGALCSQPPPVNPVQLPLPSEGKTKFNRFDQICLQW